VQQRARPKTVLQFSPGVKRLEHANARSSIRGSPESGFLQARHPDSDGESLLCVPGRRGTNWLSVANLRAVTFGACLYTAPHLQKDCDMRHLIHDVTDESAYRLTRDASCTCK